MLIRRAILTWALAEYEKLGAEPGDREVMAGLFDYHFFECIKQCILGAEVDDAHAQVSRLCREQKSPEPPPLIPVA